MYTFFGGDVLLKERYGSSSKQRFYVKPEDQRSILVLEEGPSSKNLYDLFQRIFLPQGYPDSVSKDYTTYQIFDTAQAFCSTITGTLATQEVLRGVGVGDNKSSPLAATITWVVKESCGHIGRILFAFTHGTNLDAYSKKWRLYADILNNAAMCIEITLPLFNNYTTCALCVSTMMKAIVGVAGGATRAALTQHHAIRGNLADVAAKDSAQETAVNFVASFTALFLLTILGNSTLLFMTIMVLHVAFNYLAVRSVCLRTLNEPRFVDVIDAYLKRETVLAPCVVNRQEPIMLYLGGSNALDFKLCGFHIKLGRSIMQLTKQNPNYTFLKRIENTYAARNHLLYPHIANRDMYVLLRANASVDDILCAYFHAILLSCIICAINRSSLAVFLNETDPRPFALICKSLEIADWTREPNVNIGISGFLYGPSQDLMSFVDDIVQKEWPRMKAGLQETGWDLSKHLLVADEWRILSEAKIMVSQKSGPSNSKSGKIGKIKLNTQNVDGQNSRDSRTSLWKETTDKDDSSCPLNEEQPKKTNVDKKKKRVVNRIDKNKEDRKEINAEINEDRKEKIDTNKEDQKEKTDTNKEDQQEKNYTNKEEQKEKKYTNKEYQKEKIYTNKEEQKEKKSSIDKSDKTSAEPSHPLTLPEEYEKKSFHDYHDSHDWRVILSKTDSEIITNPIEELYNRKKTEQNDKR